MSVDIVVILPPQRTLEGIGDHKHHKGAHRDLVSQSGPVAPFFELCVQIGSGKRQSMAKQNV